MAESADDLNIPPPPVIPKVNTGYKFGSANPKSPDEYQIGDDLVDFFPLKKEVPPRPLPKGFFDAIDNVLDARKQSDQAQLAYMDAVKDYQCASFDLMLTWARWQVAEAQAEAIRERRMRLKSKIAGSQPQSSGESTPDPSARDRLAGVDVSKLPAGFGKRRASGAGGAAKRPKTPTEGAPELKEPTPAATP